MLGELLMYTKQYVVRQFYFLWVLDLHLD